MCPADVAKAEVQKHVLCSPRTKTCGTACRRQPGAYNPPGSKSGSAFTWTAQVPRPRAAAVPCSCGAGAAGSWKQPGLLLDTSAAGLWCLLGDKPLQASHAPNPSLLIFPRLQAVPHDPSTSPSCSCPLLAFREHKGMQKAHSVLRKPCRLTGDTCLPIPATTPF